MEEYLEMIRQFIVSIYAGYELQLVTLTFYTIAMVVYAIIIWHFYRYLGRKDLFKKMEESSASSYVLKYLIVFPIISSIWFLILSVFLFFLAKELPVESILMAGITIVSAVRVAAYYSEDLSKDIAKLIPFALLAVFIIDPSYFSVELVMERLLTFPTLFHLILRYILFVVLLEIFLRLVSGFAARLSKPKKK